MFYLFLGLAVLIIILIIAIAIFLSRKSPSSVPPAASTATPASSMMIGMHYKTSDSNVIRLANNLQTLIDQVQASTCKSMMPTAVKLKDSMLASVRQAAASKILCDQLKTQLIGQRDVFKAQLATYPGDKELLIDNMIILTTSAIDAVCVDNKIDADKVAGLMTSILSAFC